MPDAGPWPCTLASAVDVKLRIPKETMGGGTTVGGLTPTPYGGRVADADLSVSEIQDLAEKISDIVKAAAGQEIVFHLKIRLGSDANVPGEELVERVNEILRGISEKLRLKWGCK